MGSYVHTNQANFPGLEELSQGKLQQEQRSGALGAPAVARRVSFQFEQTLHLTAHSRSTGSTG